MSEPCGLFVELKIRCSKCEKIGIVEVPLERLTDTHTRTDLPEGWSDQHDYGFRSVYCTECRKDWER